MCGSLRKSVTILQLKAFRNSLAASWASLTATRPRWYTAPLTKQELLDKITDLRRKAPLSRCLSAKSLLGPCLGHEYLDTETNER